MYWRTLDGWVCDSRVHKRACSKFQSFLLSYSVHPAKGPSNRQNNSVVDPIYLCEYLPGHQSSKTEISKDTCQCRTEDHRQTTYFEDLLASVHALRLSIPWRRVWHRWCPRPAVTAHRTSRSRLTFPRKSSVRTRWCDAPRHICSLRRRIIFLVPGKLSKLGCWWHPSRGLGLVVLVRVLSRGNCSSFGGRVAWMCPAGVKMIMGRNNHRRHYGYGMPYTIKF